MISVQNISMHYGGNYLFKNVSFLIGAKDRIGLTGKNGAGKTTLLRIIAGTESPESGSIEKPNDFVIGFLPQEKTLKNTLSVIEETKKAFVDVNNIKKKIESLTKQLTSRTDYHSEEYADIAQKLHDANERFILFEGDRINQECEKVLKGLGFVSDDFNRQLNTFSGGWQMRVELAKILLQQPQLILLDEPTNHLDIESIQWLETYLSTYSGAVMMVSHDRTFLDKITTRTLDLMNKQIYDYKTNYSDYLVKRSELIETQKATLENQQAEIQNIERFIERFRYKSSKAKQVQSKIKLLNKMDIVEVDKIDTSSIRFLFQPAPSSGRVVLDLENVSKSYGDHKVLSNIDLTIERGDFVAFIGKNGEGKSTMAKIITGEIDFVGKKTIGHNVQIGYFAQNQNELLDPELTVYDTISNVAVGDIRQKIRPLLGSFLFGNDDIEKKVKVLSGGEKTRLSLIKLLLNPYNFLILDEPTNHLDMTSKDILKNALLHYDGTAVIISHDRDFLQGLTNKVVEFKNKKIKTYLGDIFDFLEYRKIESLKELEKQTKKAESGAVKEDSEQKIAYQNRKEFERNVRKIENAILKIEQEIDSLENQISETENNLADPQKQGNQEYITKQYTLYKQLKSSLDENWSLWNEKHEELDMLINDNE